MWKVINHSLDRYSTGVTSRVESEPGVRQVRINYSHSHDVTAHSRINRDRR